MDSKAKRIAIFIVLCSMVAVMAAVVAVNYQALMEKGDGRNDKNSGAADASSPKIEEDGKVSGADLSAFLRDDTFFDKDVPQNTENETQTDENGNPVQALTLLASSVERDIRVKIVDDKGDVVIGQEFTVTVEDTGAYVDEDRDGVIRISDIKPGEYQVSLNAAQGYDVPANPVKVRVKSIVSYTVIDDIEFFVHSEDEVDVAKDDTENDELDSMDEDDTQYTALLDIEEERENAVQLGIDVSKWNKEIDWESVRAAGVDFAIIRCGYRGSKTGALVEDPYFKKNVEAAEAAGIKVGIYFFTQATNEIEAVEEASMALMLCRNYKLALPIFIDTEGAGGNGRADGLGVETRTAVCEAFCRTIENSGFNAGVYASKNWFINNLSTENLSDYTIWLAQYSREATYDGRYDLWQYTSAGTIEGIETRVDLNMCYKDF